MRVYRIICDILFYRIISLTQTIRYVYIILCNIKIILYYIIVFTILLTRMTYGYYTLLQFNKTINKTYALSYPIELPMLYILPICILRVIQYRFKGPQSTIK